MINKIYFPNPLVGKIIAVGLIFYLTISPLRPAYAQFAASCVDAAPGFVIKDPEFDQLGFHAVWQNDPVVSSEGDVLVQGTVSIANLNPATGDILPPAQDVFGSNPVSLNLTKNGPEWGYDRSGTYVFYTAYTDATYQDVRISRIDSAPDSTWTISPVLYPVGTGSPLASLDESYSAPYVSFAFVDYSSRNILGFGPGKVRATSTGFGFLNSLSPSSITRLPPETILHGRFVSGRRGPLLFPVYEEVIGGVSYRRPAYYDINARVLVQGLITDRTVRTRYVAMRAPEFAAGAAGPVGDIIIMALTPRQNGSAYVDLELYKLNRQTGEWVMFNKIVSNSLRYVQIDSPEGFVSNGRSYASMSVASSSGDESIVVIASLVPERGRPNILRVVSPTTSGVRRDDPEPFRVRPSGTTERVIVYYNEKTRTGRRTMRCDTGL